VDDIADAAQFDYENFHFIKIIFNAKAQRREDAKKNKIFYFSDFLSEKTLRPCAFALKFFSSFEKVLQK